MQAFCLENIQPADLIEQLYNAFSKTPVITRVCIKMLNQLVYNFPRHKFTHENLRDISMIILKGFETPDVYLKNYLFIILLELHRKCNAMGIMTINSITKEIDSKACVKNVNLKNMGMRCLFSNLSKSLLFDFERYVKQGLINEKTADNSVVLCTEYFKNSKISQLTKEKISDYHTAFFNSLPINKYSALLEIKKLEKEGDVHEIAKYIKNSVNDVIVIEACRSLSNLDQEVAAPYVDKVVQTLRIFLKSSDCKALISAKILNKLSLKFPTKISRANREIEDLVHSTNKSISMLSILTLLKTGNEESVRKLALKLEPFLSSMSNSYKMMAIDTMEKLSKSNYKEFVGFIKKPLQEKGDLEFKRYLLKKLDSVLNKMGDEKLEAETVRFLCNYLEDPEFYQLNMEILGILGQHLTDKKDLMHVYNRLILDNFHVQNCALQTLYDLDVHFNTLKTVENIENNPLSAFYLKNKNLKRGKFDFEELGDLKEEVFKFVDVTEEPDLIEIEEEKICRPIILTEEKDDFSISVVKKIFKEKIELEFEVKNNLDKVVLDSAVIKISNENDSYTIDVDEDGKYILEIKAEEGSVFNGIFEYKIALEEDPEDIEADSISLKAFDLTVLDFAMPCEIKNYPKKSRTVNMKLNCSQDEAIKQVVKRANLSLTTDSGNFTMTGKFYGIPIVLKGALSYTKFTTLDLEILCDDDKLAKKITAIFE
ncbi:gamma-2 coat protein [Nucleospora cyclopteri]